MKINLQLFAGMRDTLGQEVMQIDLPAPVTISALRRRLGSDYPEIDSILQHSTFAIEQKYAREEDVVPDGASVACIPPVSGG